MPTSYSFMLRGRSLASAAASVLALGGVLLLVATPASERAVAGAAREPGARIELSQAEIPWELFKAARCHCGCGNVVKGNPNGTPCFGCSVARSEHSFIQESLVAGRDPKKLLIDLYQVTLVEVFADYTDPGVAETWARARRAASELHQHRVVLRAPARSPVARRALEVAECSRTLGGFTPVQSALIEHDGPWDDTTLFLLATRAGVGADALQDCMGRIEVDEQSARDRLHAGLRGLGELPAVAVNRIAVPDDLAVIRAAIRADLMEEAL